MKIVPLNVFIPLRTGEERIRSKLKGGIMRNLSAPGKGAHNTADRVSISSEARKRAVIELAHSDIMERIRNPYALKRG